MTALAPSVPIGRSSKALLHLALVYGAFLASFVAFWPSSIVVTDEADYVRQAVAFASGHVRVHHEALLSGQETEELPSTYPVGTSLLQTPFVWAGGWSWAPLASALSLAAAMGALFRWLSEAGKSPYWSLCLAAYLPAVVLSRVAMADLPGGALVVWGLWLFWRGKERHWLNWFAAGLIAAAGLLFRESNVLIFAVYFLGAIVRRERKAVFLVLGGLLGIAVRLAVNRLLFGTYFFYRSPVFGWTWRALGDNALLYAFALLVMVPGGLWSVFKYKGWRRPETLVTVGLYVLFFSTYTYSAAQSGLAKRLILGPRFFIPLVPLLAWTLASSTAALKTPFRHRLGALACLLVGAECVAANAGFGTWTREQRQIVDAIYAHTAERSVVLHDSTATDKFFQAFYGDRFPIHYRAVPDAEILTLARTRPAFIALLCRASESEFWRRECEDQDHFVARMGALCTLQPILDRTFRTDERLRIWALTSC